MYITRQKQFYEGSQKMVSDKEKMATCNEAVSYELGKSLSGQLSVADEEVVCTLPSVDDPPPDGGLIAWLQVLVSFICSSNCWGLTNIFGVYQQFYQDDLLRSTPPGTIAWIGSVAQCLAFVGSVFFGAPLDAGYMRTLAIAATCLQFLSLMLLGSVCRSFWSIMLTQGVLTGLVSSALFVVSVGSVAQYFAKKRTLAISIGTTGGSVFGTLYSVIGRRLIGEVGFAWSTRTIAFIQLGTCLIMCCCVRQRIAPRKRKALIAFETFKEPAFMLYCVANLFAFAGLVVFYFHYQAYALIVDPRNTTYLYITAIINAGSFVGRLVPGYLAGKYGGFNVLIITMASSTVLAYCWMVAKTPAGIITIGVLFGIASGPQMSLPGAIVAELTSQPNRLGIRMAVLFIFNGVGVLLGAPFAGIIWREHGWFWAKLYCSLAFTVGTSLVICSRMIRSKGKLFARV